MSKAPAMPMYWDAYLADTTHLTTEEHGAYMLLLAAMWRRNGSVPDDDKDNARILGLSQMKWRKIKARFQSTISGFLIEGDAITQEKLRKTWENTQEKIAKNKQNGAKGGRAAASKNNDLGQANATVSQERKASIPEPEPEPYNKRDTNVSLVKPADDFTLAFLAYNEAAERVGWPQVQKFSQTRRAALRARFKDAGGLDGFILALGKAEASDFLTGDNKRGWTADFDFICTAKNFTKIMEGGHDNRVNPNNRTSQRREDRPDPALEQISRLAGLR